MIEAAVNHAIMQLPVCQLRHNTFHNMLFPSKSKIASTTPSFQADSVPWHGLTF
jgi:hypothetical protein